MRAPIISTAIVGLALAVLVHEVSRPPRATVPPHCIVMQTATFDGKLSKPILACTDTVPHMRRINAATFPDGQRRHLYTNLK